MKLILVYLFICFVSGQIEEDSEPETSLDVTGIDSRLLLALQAISERLRALESADKTRLSKLQDLHYRFDSLEAGNEERILSIRSEVESLSRNLQGVQWDVNKVTTLLEILRQDIARIIQGVTEIKVLGSRYPNTGDIAKNERSNSKLRVISSLHNIKTDVGKILENVQTIDKNSKNILNYSRSALEQTTDLATKSDIHENLLDLREECSSKKQQRISLSRPVTDFNIYPENCAELQGMVNSGVHLIQPVGYEPFFTFCELKSGGGGWTVIQSRIDGATDFYLKWLDYKHGFGNIGAEHWLGLDKIYSLTSRKIQTLRIELVDFDLTSVEAEYKAFAIGSEMEGYNLKVLAEYNGTAGDSLSYQSGMKFSTWDNDNDAWKEGNCAKEHTGAWWYKGCETSNLNGKYLTGRLPEDLKSQGIYWYDFHGNLYSLMKSRMMIRPRDWKFKEVSEETLSSISVPTQPFFIPVQVNVTNATDTDDDFTY